MTLCVDVEEEDCRGGWQDQVDNQEVPGMGRLCLFTAPKRRMLGVRQPLVDRKSL